MKLTLRAVIDADFLFLYELLRQRLPCENISHKEMPTYDEHLAFWKLMPYRYSYIVLSENDSVGMVYVTMNNEVGIHFVENINEYKQVIDLLREETGITKMFFNVAPTHYQLRHTLDREIGAKLIQYTYERIS